MTNRINLTIHLEYDEVVERLKAEGWVIPVRCKECKHFKPFRKHDGFCSIDGMLWDNNHFCKCGDRREEGADDV